MMLLPVAQNAPGEPDDLASDSGASDHWFVVRGEGARAVVLGARLFRLTTDWSPSSAVDGS